MKRILLAIYAILVCFPAFSQINLKDSTVQVVAYWEKGEKYNYSFESSKYSVNGTDTTWNSREKDIINIEVIDSTAQGYLLKCTTLEDLYDSKIEGVNDIIAKISKVTDNIPIVIKTDIYGTFEGIANMEEYKNAILEGVKVLKSEIDSIIENQIKDTGLDKEKENQMREYIYSAINTLMDLFKNDNYIYKSIEPITSLLYFHGAEMKIGKKYTSSNIIQNPLDPASTLESVNEFFIYKYDTEASCALFTNKLVYNPEQLKQGLAVMMKNMLPPQERETKEIDVPDINMEFYTYLYINTDSGWPIYGQNEQITTSDGIQKITSFEMTLIME